MKYILYIYNIMAWIERAAPRQFVKFDHWLRIDVTGDPTVRSSWNRNRWVRIEKNFLTMQEIRNPMVGFGIMSKSNLEKVAVSAVRWLLMEIDCTGFDKIIKNSNNLCKIIRNDLESIGMKNSIFEKIKIDFYQNELVWTKFKTRFFLNK